MAVILFFTNKGEGYLILLIGVNILDLLDWYS